jgi:hypothetical protein
MATSIEEGHCLDGLSKEAQSCFLSFFAALMVLRCWFCFVCLVKKRDGEERGLGWTLSGCCCSLDACWEYILPKAGNVGGDG